MDLFLLLSVICWMFVDSESADSVQKTVSAVEGQTVSLPCEAPNKETIRVVEWTRPDLKDQEVLLFRDGHFDPDNHPSYKNRVDLKDRTMKDGDVSLILKNVAFNDSGTYQCYIKQREQSRKKRSAEDTVSLSSVSLSVVPGDTGGRGGDRGRGRVGLSVGLTVAALVVVGGILGVVMFQKKKEKSPPPPDSDPDHDEPLNQFDSETPTGV